MDFDSSENSTAKFAGKIKTQTFKQFQLERLIKDGNVTPVSKLVKLMVWSCNVAKTLKRRP